MLYLQREILKKLGGPAQGTQNVYYNTIKSLLERVAPVMIDASAVDKLVNHVDDSVRGLGIITEGIDNAAEKSVKLLVVSWVGLKQNKHLKLSDIDYVQGSHCHFDIENQQLVLPRLMEVFQTLTTLI